MTPGLVGAIVSRVRERVPGLEARVHGFEAPALAEGDPGPVLPYAVVSPVSGIYTRHSGRKRHGAEQVQVSVFAATAAQATLLADQADRELSGGPLGLAGDAACYWLGLGATVVVKDPGRSREGSDIYQAAATYRAHTQRPAPPPR